MAGSRGEYTWQTAVKKRGGILKSSSRFMPSLCGRNEEPEPTVGSGPSSSVPEAAPGAPPAAGTAPPPQQSQDLDLPGSTLHGYPPLPTPGQASWNPAKACVPLEAGVSLTAPAGQYVTRRAFGKCQPAAPTSGGFQDRIRQSTARCREARGSCCTASYGRRRGRIVAGRVFPEPDAKGCSAYAGRSCRLRIRAEGFLRQNPSESRELIRIHVVA